MRRIQPGVSFHIEISTSSDIVRAVAQQIVPFGLCLLPKPIPTIACHFLFRETFGIFCGRSHHLAGVREVSIESIRSEPWVAFASETLEPFVALRLGASITNRLAATSCDLQEVRRFISVGAGTGVLPLAAARRDAAEGGLWQLPIYDTGELRADLCFIYHPAAQHTPAELAFRQKVLRFKMSDTVVDSRGEPFS